MYKDKNTVQSGIPQFLHSSRVVSYGSEVELLDLGRIKIHILTGADGER